MESICTIAVVNPFASVEYLITSLRKENVKIIAIYVPDNFTIEDKKVVDDSEFDLVFEYRNDAERAIVIDQLKELNISRIIYGSDFDTVPATDDLAQIICPKYANDPTSSKDRVNKFNSNQALENSGVTHCKQTLVNKPKLTDEQCKLIDLLEEVIVKPTISSASFLVKECKGSKEVATYIQNNLGEHRNFRGYFMENYKICSPEFVVQEKIIGEEYLVDVVSSEGNHCITGVFKYCKEFINNIPICRSIKAVDINSAEIISLCNYVKDVLDATGFKNNISHNEVFISKEKGPMLVEINPRISGAHGFINIASDISYERTQVKMLVKSITLENEFLSAACKLPELKKSSIIVKANCFKEKVFNGLNMEALGKIRSFTGIYDAFGYRNGEKMRFPKSLADCVGVIILENADKEELDRDYLKVRELEESGDLYN